MPPASPSRRSSKDPWQSFECDGSPEGCSITFEDPDYTRLGRDTVYYVRALEAPKPGVNAGGIHCERNLEGNCIHVTLCDDVSVSTIASPNMNPGLVLTDFRRLERRKLKPIRAAGVFSLRPGRDLVARTGIVGWIFLALWLLFATQVDAGAPHDPACRARPGRLAAGL